MEEKSTASNTDIVPGQREGEILEAAIELIAVHGFHSTSTRRIAKEAGVSESTIFYHFGSKEGLLIVILQNFYARLIDSAQANLKQSHSTYDKLLRIALNHVHHIAERNALMLRLMHTNFIVDMHWQADIKRSPLHELTKRYAAVFDNVVLEGIEHGALQPDLKLRTFRDIFYGGLEYAMRTTLIHKDELDDKNYIVKIVDGVWATHATDIQQTGTDRSQSDSLDTMFERLEAATKKIENLTDKG